MHLTWSTMQRGTNAGHFLLMLLPCPLGFVYFAWMEIWIYIVKHIKHTHVRTPLIRNAIIRLYGTFLNISIATGTQKFVHYTVGKVCVHVCVSRYVRTCESVCIPAPTPDITGGSNLMANLQGLARRSQKHSRTKSHNQDLVDKI